MDAISVSFTDFAHAEVNYLPGFDADRETCERVVVKKRAQCVGFRPHRKYGRTEKVLEYRNHCKANEQGRYLWDDKLPNNGDRKALGALLDVEDTIVGIVPPLPVYDWTTTLKGAIYLEVMKPAKEIAAILEVLPEEERTATAKQLLWILIAV